jgi:hypothetical protein
MGYSIYLISYVSLKLGGKKNNQTAHLIATKDNVMTRKGRKYGTKYLAYKVLLKPVVKIVFSPLMQHMYQPFTPKPKNDFRSVSINLNGP